MTELRLRAVGERAVMLDIGPVAGGRDPEELQVNAVSCQFTAAGHGELASTVRTSTAPTAGTGPMRPGSSDAGPQRPPSVAAAIRRLAARGGVDVVDVVPGAVTVLVVAATPDQLARLVAALPDLDTEDDEAAPAPRVIELPVRYDGPDLGAVAGATGLSVAEVVRRHSEATYQAAFTGFSPGFAYLAGLDPALHLPRRPSFRPSVPPGSVAIADHYTAVYPRSTPGGWHLLGSTTATMFDSNPPDGQRPALIAPGDLVRMVIRPGPLP